MNLKKEASYWVKSMVMFVAKTTLLLVTYFCQPRQVLWWWLVLETIASWKAPLRAIEWAAPQE